jgi:hypothetical protein
MDTESQIKREDILANLIRLTQSKILAFETQWEWVTGFEPKIQANCASVAKGFLYLRYNELFHRTTVFISYIHEICSPNIAISDLNQFRRSAGNFCDYRT